MAANPTPRPARFVPAFEVIRGRRPTGGREVGWLKDTRWRGGLNRELKVLGYRRSAKLPEQIVDESVLETTPRLNLAPDQVRLVEEYWAEGLAHKVAWSVSRRVPPPFRFDHPKYGGCQEFLSESAYWLVLSVSRYKQLPGVDFKSAVRKRMAGAIRDLVRRDSHHHSLQVRCESCAGTGVDIAGGCKCVDCRGRGYGFTPNIDGLLDEHVPSAAANGNQPAVADHEDPAETPLEALLNREAESSVWEAVDRLPDLQRKLIRALFQDEVSQIDEARVSGVSQPTVSRQLGAAKEALKRTALDWPIHRAPNLPKPAGRDDWWARLRKRHTPYTHGSTGANQRARISFHLEVSE